MDDVGGWTGFRRGRVVVAGGEFFIGAGSVQLDVEFDQVGFEIPYPAVFVGEDGVGVFGEERERSARSLVAELLKFGHEQFVNVVIIAEAVDDVDALERREIDHGASVHR